MHYMYHGIVHVALRWWVSTHYTINLLVPALARFLFVQVDQSRTTHLKSMIIFTIQVFWDFVAGPGMPGRNIETQDFPESV